MDLEEQSRSASMAESAFSGEKRMRTSAPVYADAEEDDETSWEEQMTAARLDELLPNSRAFVRPGQPFPRDHVVALRAAEEVMLDRVRVLLDLHYESVARVSWEASSGAIDAETAKPRTLQTHRVFARVLEAHAQQRYDIFVLPKTVTAILRGCRNELRWDKVEVLRCAVLDSFELPTELTVVTQSDLDTLHTTLGSSLHGVLPRDLHIAGRLLPRGTSVAPVIEENASASAGTAPCVPSTIVARLRSQCSRTALSMGRFGNAIVDLSAPLRNAVAPWYANTDEEKKYAHEKPWISSL